MAAKPRCVNLRDHEVRQLLKTGEVLWVRPCPEGESWESGYPPLLGEDGLWRGKGIDALPARCPLGQVGDVVCGREAWQTVEREVVYRATPETNHLGWNGYHWRSPATMPRWASRLSPRIAKVECRRVGSITWDEAIMAGVAPHESPDGGNVIDGFQVRWDHDYPDLPFRGERDAWAWFVTLTTGEQK